MDNDDKLSNLADAIKDKASKTKLKTLVTKAQVGGQLDRTIADAIMSCFDSFGLYPASVSGYGDQRDYIERSDYQNGWNDAYSKLLDSVCKAVERLDEDPNGDLALLLLADLGWMTDRGFELNLNDTFYYACADGELVSKEELPEVARMFKRYGYDGPVYWAAKKRGIKSKIGVVQKEIEEIEKREQERNKGKIK